MTRELTVREMTKSDCREVCSWRYEGAFSVYDYPDYEEMKRSQTGFMKPGARYLAYASGDVLVGITHASEKPDGVRIGIAVNPSLLGRGYGRRILGMACQTAGAESPGREICVVVRAWNERALRCYRAAGFEAVGEPFRMCAPGGEDTFVKMLWMDTGGRHGCDQCNAAAEAGRRGI